MKKINIVMISFGLGISACSKPAEAPKAATAKPTPKAEPEKAAPAGPFSLAWSEYPSWSVFDVAHSKGYINGKAGALGTVEKKWNVDIVLKEAEYDPCIVLYGTGAVDAVAITNMDILKPSLTRKAVAILPTSTSYGADAVLVTNEVKDLEGLKQHAVRGLDLSVSEYMFARNLQLLGQDPKAFKFKSMDPGAAALAMQQKNKSTQAIAVWNPFVLETLEKRKGEVRVLFDSTSIPGEIVDMVVVAEASLDKPGGDAFATALADAFYRVNQDLANPATRDDTLKAIGEKFSNLSAEKMKTVVQQTKFYGTAQEGVAVFEGGPVLEGKTQDKLQDIMGRVIGFSEAYGILDKKISVAYGATATPYNLRFDASFMKKAGGIAADPK